MKKTYSVKEAAKILGYSTNSIYTFVNEKRIKSVRVGKGRFRIPASELEKFLGGPVSEVKTAPVPPVMNSADESAPVAQAKTPFPPPPAASASSGEAAGLTGSTKFLNWFCVFPNLFDWFLGITAFLTGLSLLLFDGYARQEALSRYNIPYAIPGGLLIACGLVLIFIAVYTWCQPKWRMWAHGLLAVIYLFMTVLFMMSGDFDAVVLYGILCASIVVSFLYSTGGVAIFSLFLSGLAAAYTILMLFAPTDAHMARILSIIGISNVWLAIAWVVACAAGVYLYVWADGKMRFLAVFLVFLASLVAALWAAGYASDLAWSRAFFFMTVSFFLLYTDLWDAKRLVTRRDRYILSMSLGVILLLEIAAMILVYVFQNNIVAYASEHLTDKAAYVRLVVETTMESGPAALKSAVTNPLTSQSFSDTGTSANAAKSIFEFSQRFRRIEMIDSAGILRGVYPEDPVRLGMNLSAQEYFRNSMETRKYYQSDVVFLPESPNDPAMYMASPVIGANGEPVGVIAGVFDLSQMARRVSSLASERYGEFIRVEDRNGQLIVSPTFRPPATADPLESYIRRGIAGEQGVETVRESNGNYTLAAFTGIPAIGWGVIVASTYTGLLRQSALSALSILGIFAAGMLLTGIFFVMRDVEEQQVRIQKS